MTLLYSVLFLTISIGLSILVVHFALRWINYSFNRQYIYFGMAIFFVGIGLHSLIALPVVVLKQGLKTFWGILSQSKKEFNLWGLFYFAAAAGMGQEIAKMLPILFELKRTDGKNPTPPYFWLGLNIGLGFSLSEILFITINDLQSNMVKSIFYNIFMGSFERLGATLFHMATGGLIAFGIEKGKGKYSLLISIGIHTFLDAFASFTSKFPIVSSVIEELILFSFSLLLFITILVMVQKCEQNIVDG